MEDQKTESDPANRRVRIVRSFSHNLGSQPSPDKNLRNIQNRGVSQHARDSRAHPDKKQENSQYDQERAGEQRQRANADGQADGACFA